MSRVVIAAVAAVLTSFSAASADACPGEQAGSCQAPSKVKSVSVGELATLQQRKAVTVFDVNTPETRTKQGVIPGAKLLSAASSFDVAKELPNDKSAPLVFYCANQKCKASHVAAERAAKAGFTDVSILPDGIAGWKAAGQKAAQVETGSKRG